MEQTRLSKIIIIKWSTTIGTIVFCFGFLLSEIKHIDIKIDRWSERTDRLYEMFVNVGKESDQKFMELRKEAEQARKESDRQWKELREQYEQARKESDRQWMELKKESDQRFYDLLKETNNTR